MRHSIKAILYQGIIERKWVNISYVNKDDDKTDYYIGIKSVDPTKDIISCDIYNPYNANKLIDKDDLIIKISRIKNAKVLDQSYYPTPEKLLTEVNENMLLQNYLDVTSFDNNILAYISDCYKYDNDPCIKESIMLDGIDLKELSKSRVVQLDENQFAMLIAKLFIKKNKVDYSLTRFATLAINSFSIDIEKRSYVVAYRVLKLNFKNRTLCMEEDTVINKSFLIEEDKKVTLSTYLDISQEEFIANYAKNKREYIEMINENFHNGEIVNTRPFIFIQERTSNASVERTFEAISLMESEKKLSFPLKSFFGRARPWVDNSQDPNIVVFNRNKVNIDQLRVIYNSMVNHVTFVKGPPGTGKTETIFNVLLSAYANNKNVLVCSNNNHPVNDIFEKMVNSFSRKNAETGEIEKVNFPIIRIGNNEENFNTLIRLKFILDYAQKNRKIFTQDSFTEQTKNKLMKGYSELRNLLKAYEIKVETQETADKLLSYRSFAISDKVIEQIDKHYQIQLDKANEIKQITDKEVAQYTISANEDTNFQNYIFYSALGKFKKLLSSPYKDLREIIESDDTESASIKLNKYLREDENLKKFLNVFPIVVCTNLSCDKLGSPSSHFDLCIMDEAGQCNIANSLIPIVRADDLLLVGDTNQLQPVTVLETNVNDDLMNKYGIKNEYNYINNSILSTYLKKDNNSKSILLRYHYRCGMKIADFINNRYYEKQLKLLNETKGNLVYVDVENNQRAEERNSYDSEAKEIVKIIKEGKYKDVGIVTPFVNQAALINMYLSSNGITDVKAGTIHTLQGSEKSTIIFSSALSLKTSKKTFEWIKNNHELINVAVTRAKKTLIYVGDKQAIDLLSKDDEKDKPNDIKTLSDYVFNNGEIVVPKSDVVINYDFSNNSENEKEFFATITPYFNKRNSKMRIERNVPVKDAIKNIKEEDLKIIGKKEFDVIVQAGEGLLTTRYRTIVVFEVDGGEHIGSKETARRDREKELVCQLYNIKLIRIANSQVKDYELIIRLFESIIKKIPDLENTFEQISLFGE
ncbi:MAG: hypothetical protein K6E21_00460 [Bacilli bacterium]|nr:hypothetical protein [Bacilli bacterium]